MRILHTSDWHLGKRLFKLDRTQEHEFFLNWLIDTLKSESIDVLLIAGDIFDTPMPPHQSIQMFYDFLSRVSVETKTETYIIAGNHDSGLLLEAPSKILKDHRVKVWGKLSDPQEHWVKIKKGNEEVELCSIPFFRSHELLPHGDGDALLSLETYLKKEKSSPQILMLHHLAGMYEASGSEQVINLSGVDSIPTAILKSFDYVALGHIHKPQRIGENMYYSGSPIPLRFSETQKKSVVIATVQDGKITSEIKEIPQARAFGMLKAQEEDFRDKIKALELNSSLTPMLEVQLTLSSPRVGIIDEIKSLLEKKGIELLSYLPFYSGIEKKEKKNDKLFELSPMELFEEFYQAKYPDAPEIPADLKKDFAELVDKVKHAPRST